MQANVYQQYKTQSLETLTKGELVVKLFEEASKQVTKGIFLKDQGDSVSSYNAIAKAQKVISTLSFSLDMKRAISLELNEMYLFLHQKLGEANAKGDVALMKELLVLIDELKVTFRQAEKLARMSKN